MWALGSAGRQVPLGKTGFWTGAGVQPGPEVSARSPRGFPERAARLDAAAPRVAPEGNMATGSGFSDLATCSYARWRDPPDRLLFWRNSRCVLFDFPEVLYAD